MNLVFNIIWIVFGGLMVAVEYAVSSVAMMITIIGIPFGLALWPFGTEITDDGWPSGCLAGVMNVVWWFVGGIPIALTHLLWGIIFCVTVVGIPFGMQHFKLMKLALFPFGTKVG